MLNRPIELFFKLIKQHLRIKKFYGNLENAVKLQRGGDLAQYVWIAVSIYVLVAIIKNCLNLDVSLYILLQIFSLTVFKKMPNHQAFAGSNYISDRRKNRNQLNLFAF